uniref:Uncharacterized protein n=1 Tax=Rubinisphaera brasiliensis (strain ATCC 49424 / DSM 5305 / JCM 21570 / IAM 15109 / NBRC 103401 / IFAM 1448) TaxID=756272 RepID=F0SLE0_RUBBR|nr:hypothetical protein Plabr_4474 [Rubinisphaera brasiliensis DSM 5305]
MKPAKSNDNLLVSRAKCSGEQKTKKGGITTDAAFFYGFTITNSPFALDYV